MYMLGMGSGVACCAYVLGLGSRVKGVLGLCFGFGRPREAQIGLIFWVWVAAWRVYWAYILGLGSRVEGGLGLFLRSGQPRGGWGLFLWCGWARGGRVGLIRLWLFAALMVERAVALLFDSSPQGC